ncbi:MgtC/SapB family protein [Spiribacter halobius]|uniref:Uncharacterized protein n=1 Tax=Sediminicurvatus halobius TaxID=2182432 RepID=A0A2U2N8D8_9GAMM|nr:MgtC/SapB family protein [Spiribacter halobius]PWG65455.1 hypothetical protein DEM34_01560 [Spiribacter halobius]UEX76476.1 MgtC/SapB family protein [Spiribacter halobius]
MQQDFLQLGVALVIGLLVGLERGWRLRDADEGARVAGIRTFALVGLAGGLAGVVSDGLGDWLVVAALLALVALLWRGFQQEAERSGDVGVTTEVAVVVTYLLGVIAVRGEPAVAAAGAVVTAGLLGSKDVLHGALRRLDELELRAVLQLALISIVVLPVLPDRGYGPWAALNPREMWLMVVLISGIGFFSHFAVRIAGPRRGLLATGLFAGLASSTALTLALARAARQTPERQRLLAAAVVIASTMMFPRVLLEVAAVNRALVPSLLAPLLTLTAVGTAAAVWLAMRARAVPDRGGGGPARPFELTTALQFAALLAVVMLAAEAARRYFGESGIYTLALLSGLTDVDAITLSLGRLARDELAAPVAVRGIVIAALANTAVKGGLVLALAGGLMGLAVAAALGAVLIAGLLWLPFL